MGTADQDGSLSSPLPFARLPQFEQQSFVPSLEPGSAPSAPSGTTCRPEPNFWEHPDRSNRAFLSCFCPDQHRPSRERAQPPFCTTSRLARNSVAPLRRSHTFAPDHFVRQDRRVSPLYASTLGPPGNRPCQTSPARIRRQATSSRLRLPAALSSKVSVCLELIAPTAVFALNH